MVGRSEQGRETVTAGALERLAATLDRADLGLSGDAIPPLGHWLFFLPQARQSEIGPHGHTRRGGIPVASSGIAATHVGGKRAFLAGELRVGDGIVRHSTIKSVSHKIGASGPLIYVTVRHEIGRPGETGAIIDEHDIIYRGLEGRATKPAPRKAQTCESACGAPAMS